MNTSLTGVWKIKWVNAGEGENSVWHAVSAQHAAARGIRARRGEERGGRWVGQASLRAISAMASLSSVSSLSHEGNQTRDGPGW